MDIKELLTFTKEQGASDLHLSAGVPPIVRLHGSLRRLKMDSFGAEELHGMLYTILSEDQRKDSKKSLSWISLTASTVAQDSVSIFFARGGEKAPPFVSFPRNVRHSLN